MKPCITILLLEYIFSLIFTREFCLLCAQGRVGQAQHLFSWRRISQSEIRNSAAAESEGGQKFLPPNPLPFLPARAFSLAREARRQFRSKKVRISSNKRTDKNCRPYGRQFLFGYLYAFCAEFFKFREDDRQEAVFNGRLCAVRIHLHRKNDGA